MAHLVTAVIPLKAVHAAKTRMSPSLSAADRSLLLRRTFDRVVAAVAASTSVVDTLVVVGDAVGRGWAAHHGLAALDEPAGTPGLNAAIAAADRHLGTAPTVVVPADLPLITGDDLDAVVAALPGESGVVVAPTGDGGTGALVRAPGGIITPCFGPASAAAHAAAADAAGVGVRVVRIAGLALDLDQPDDIERAGGWSAVTGPTTLTH